MRLPQITKSSYSESSPSLLAKSNLAGTVLAGLLMRFVSTPIEYKKSAMRLLAIIFSQINSKKRFLIMMEKILRCNGGILKKKNHKKLK